MPDVGPILRMSGVTKRYGATVALDSVDFVLGRGEIQAVLGENGAGKSTLMHIVRGLTRPDSGSIEVDGEAVILGSPEIARSHGIGMVHQHFMLVPSFTVADNLALAAERPQWRLGAVRKDVSAKAAAIADRLGWRFPIDTRVGDLPVGTRQRVEIVRALMNDATILLFDEPTAVLAPTETVELFRVLRSLRDEGRSIVFVSHKLSEVMDLCDRVTVLRRGKVVGTLSISETNPRDLAERMVGLAEAPAVLDTSSAPLPSEERGRSVVSPSPFQEEGRDDVIPTTPLSGGERRLGGERYAGPRPVVSIHDLSTEPRPNAVTLRNISFQVMPGEILGFAGVDGNGQGELAEVLTGLRAWSSGSLTFDGRPLSRLDPSRLQDLGIALIPPDRHREGLALDLSIEENLMLQAVDMPEYRFGPFVRLRKLREYAADLAGGFDIRAGDLRLPARSLSGGNQQKIVAARALARKPKLLIAVSPTRGLDVAATAYIHTRLRQRRKEGGAIVLISTELDEVIDLSDRIAVLSRGEIVDIVDPGTPRTSIGLMMGGGIPNA